jgi:hypothetical protein
MELAMSAITPTHSTKKPGYRQISFYVRPALAARWKALSDKYPHVTESSLVNAAVEFYLPYAEHGLDGNLMPWHLTGGGPRELLREEIKAILADLQGEQDASSR